MAKSTPNLRFWQNFLFTLAILLPSIANSNRAESYSTQFFRLSLPAEGIYRILNVVFVAESLKSLCIGGNVLLKLFEDFLKRTTIIFTFFLNKLPTLGEPLSNVTY